MKVREALSILEKLNPDLGLFICLNINPESFVKGIGVNRLSVITINGFVNCSSFIGIIPTTSLETKCLI